MIDQKAGCMSGEVAKNRYINAPRQADFSIGQNWQSYDDQEHDRWRRLYHRMDKILPNRACDIFLAAKSDLQISDQHIPDMKVLSKRLCDRTGWQIVPVAGLVPDEIFFEHLANKRFPAAAFIRPEEEFDYLQEPDIFHDIFGHIPMLADPVFADFMQKYGQGGLRAMRHGKLHHLARLYWYSVEFGLIQQADGIRIFGAGILSSPEEAKYALESLAPNKIGFEVRRVMQTDYKIDDFQQTYFVIDDFETLQNACYEDFGPLYQSLEALPDLPPNRLQTQDKIIQSGAVSS